MSYFNDKISKMQGYIPGFQPSGSDIIKLNTNENPYPPSPRAMAAINTITPDQLRRYPSPTGEKFREIAAALNGVDPENIICTNGGDDLLTIAIRSFCDGSNPLSYPVLTYSLYPVLAKIQGCETIEVPFNPDYSLPKELENVNSGLTIVCNPNAPSGTIVKPLELAELASKIKGVLLIDEAYADFAPYNCVGLVKEFDNVIILRSMSKGYSLAGLRFGYGIGNKELIENMIGKVKDSYNVDAIAIEAASAALSDQQYFKENVEKIKFERQRLIIELRKLGFEVADSHTNFVLAKCPNHDGERVYDELVKKNIYVRYWNSPGLSDKLRITVGRPEENDALVNVLKEIV